MKDIEKVLKALANKRRLGILALLKRKDGLSVGDIAREIKLSLKSTSRHLAVLASVAILDKEQVSLNVFYKLPPNPHKLVRYVLTIL
ncbi:MAG: hypothetical protein A3B23_00280 [Candidatus Colwellbacteria bacterium RIFCSPLOWO2_01_FULL_48_10]|uniref:HTH arsR-type domain-containing protein n=1 Tax=Candidatus Colwellbacteria bacterium RIFCSPLOWO2_01_FULL_48_10 TaxID=1797690 RepID=A0A1G1Z5N1_9BACT|nr:MAG: hypothetical protein A3B23_00280 [Candidatus Colwellbacteria bacterium RIFCSPLOWO2_01_FULL_48_10]